MLFSTLAYVAAALFSTAAVAVPAPQATSEALKPNEFYIKTSSKVKEFDSLWLFSYHTGAGLGDAAFNKSSQYKEKAYFSGTNLTFNLGTTFPWGLELAYEPYTTFSPVTINVGVGQPGFSLDKNHHIVYNNALQLGVGDFGGWLVCKWWHDNTPQLFWTANYVKNAKYPSNCGKIDLVATRTA